MISYLKTKRDKVFKIYDETQFIGYLNTKLNGAVTIHPSSVYKKYDAFGLKKEILISDIVEFKWVIAYYNGEGYWVLKDKMIAEGIEDSFDFGIKLFLPRKKWNTIKSSDQLSIEFEGSIK